MARKWWVLAAVCTGVMMLLLDVTIVNVALPSIERDFSASLTDLQWVISGYALALAAFLLTAGSLADRYGRRLVFAIGLIVFTAASMCCGISTGPCSSWLHARFRVSGGRSCSPPRWLCSLTRSAVRIGRLRSVSSVR